MIKVNLLPTDKKKKRPSKKVSALQQQLLVGGLVLILIGLAMGYFWTRQKIMIASLERQKTAAEKRIQEQDNLLKEVKNVEEERKKVSEKIELIEQLKKNQGGPVRLLDEISKALPQGVGLLSLAENNKNVDIEGEAFTNEDVVRFVDRLKASPLLSGVMLLETSLGKREGVDIYKYKLQFVYKGL
ncbi:MAG TPA: PilN domain-containing protein [Nitrospirota bacterium]